MQHRWLGGTLTNWVTLQKSIKRLKLLKAMVEDGRMADLPKKEAARLERELKHLQQNFAGVENMATLPDAMFVIDPNNEQIAVREARRMGVPVVAIVDTNCDPDIVDVVIPGNDDALRAIRLFTSKIADAVISGRQLYERTQIADQKTTEGADLTEKVDYVDTSAYEKYEKPEGDFAEVEPAEVLAAAAAEDAAAPGEGRIENQGLTFQRPVHLHVPSKKPEFNWEGQNDDMTTQSGGPNIPAQLVKELRERTGAGFAACREALLETKGDIEQAINVLRKKGQAAAQKKAQRATSEGMVGYYIHAGGKIGVLVEVNCESDFVARTEDFQKLCHDVAMHIAALDPRFLKREEVTQEILDRERDIYKDQAKQTGKPDNVIEKIVNGKMEKFYEENCLYEQHFIRDESVTVKELIDQAIAKVGENIAVRRFARFKVGEGDGAAPAAPVAAGDVPAPA